MILIFIKPQREEAERTVSLAAPKKVFRSARQVD
jgi:hypothetical protein